MSKERKTEREKRKKKRMKGAFVRQRRNVRECDQHEISTCVFHSLAILSRSTRRSSVFFVHRRGPFFGVASSLFRYGRADSFFSHGMVSMPRLTSSETRPPPSGYSFVRYFSSGTLARQSYSPVALSPTRTVSFNLARVI